MARLVTERLAEEKLPKRASLVCNGLVLTHPRSSHPGPLPTTLRGADTRRTPQFEYLHSSNHFIQSLKRTHLRAGHSTPSVSASLHTLARAARTAHGRRLHTVRHGLLSLWFQVEEDERMEIVQTNVHSRL